MLKRWVLIDMSSELWRALLTGEDKEFGRRVPHPTKEDKDVVINSAQYGLDIFIGNFVATLGTLKAVPRDVVMVFDGKHAKAFRQQISSDYKAGRSHAPESYEEFTKLAAMAKQTILDLGGIAVEQPNMEADDVLAYLSQQLKRSVIVSNDGDLLALHTEKCDVWRTGTGEMNINKYGPFPHRFITVYKALVGDASDNIKGAHKFGPKAFIELLVAFGFEGLEAMEGLMKERQLDRLSEDVGELKQLQRIIDSKDSVYTSWDLARMYPDKVNTVRMPLDMKAGLLRQWDAAKHDARLKHWHGHSRLVHAGNFEQAAAWAFEKLLASPEVPFDIETSTPPESDEWLEAKKRNGGAEEGGKLGVDVLGSELTGASVAFGDNCQYSFYIPVGHVETPEVKNVTSAQVRQFMERIPDSKPIVVHNSSFELTVLLQAWGEAWKDNGWHGCLPNVHDTLLMKSYVDENSSLGLKQCSLQYLGYEQVSYADVTQGRKMNQMTAEETTAYGIDDSVCSGALYNFFRFVMEIEQTTDVFMAVEQKPSYLNAIRFVRGADISLERMRELEEEDTVAYDAAATTLRAFLMDSGWEGTVLPVPEKTAAFIKFAYELATNKPLETKVRTPDKLVKLIEAEGADILASLLAQWLVDDDSTELMKYLKIYFSGEPTFDIDSPKQMKHMLYDVLGLPVRLRNKATDTMRAAGNYEGTPRTDDYAIQFALKFDEDKGPRTVEVLRAIQTMKIVGTRRKLFYTPYRNVKHWKTGRVHSQLRQSATNTRRYAEADPNKQQLPKHAKHGQQPKFREIFVPHKKRAVIVSLDFTGQELVSIAEQAQDPNMVACFAPPPGQSKKDMHLLTGVGIWQRKKPAELALMSGKPLDPARAEGWANMTYERMASINGDSTHPDNKLVKRVRDAGKRTNFTTEYGAQAPKLAERLICTPEEAQQYIDAKEAAFPRSGAWKKEVIAEAHKLGYAPTMLGARRHLRDLLRSANRFDASKAERQAVNFSVQGSCAEQTKLAEARLWDMGVFFKYDAVYIGPIHDELVSSCSVDDLIPFITDVHAAMTANYAGMKLPIVASISFGPNFGEQLEVGETVDETKIREALRELGFSETMTTA